MLAYLTHKVGGGGTGMAWWRGEEGLRGPPARGSDANQRTNPAGQSKGSLNGSGKACGDPNKRGKRSCMSRHRRSLHEARTKVSEGFWRGGVWSKEERLLRTVKQTKKT